MMTLRSKTVNKTFSNQRYNLFFKAFLSLKTVAVPLSALPAFMPLTDMRNCCNRGQLHFRKALTALSAVSRQRSFKILENFVK